jgi:hypothetical protein
MVDKKIKLIRGCKTKTPTTSAAHRRKPIVDLLRRKTFSQGQQFPE